MSERREEEERLGGGGAPGYVHPVNIDQLYRYFLEHVDSPKRVVDVRAGEEKELIDLQIVEELATLIKRSFVSRGSLIVSVSSSKAFMEDVKRKFELVYMIAIEILNVVKADVENSLREYGRAVASGDIERASKLADRIDLNIRKLMLMSLAILKVMDDLAGVLQLNLPLDVMSNLVKAHLGVVTT